MIIYSVSPEDELARRLLEITLQETARDQECIALLNDVDDKTEGAISLMRGGSDGQ